MNTLVKEEHYVMHVGTDKYMFRVQEFVWGPEPWPEKFRALISAPNDWNAMTVYGSTGQEAAETAAEYVLSLAALQMSGMERPGVGSLGPN